MSKELSKDKLLFIFPILVSVEAQSKEVLSQEQDEDMKKRLSAFTTTLDIVIKDITEILVEKEKEENKHKDNSNVDKIESEDKG